MGGKPGKSEEKPIPKKLDLFQTYSKATDSSSVSLNETPRDKTHAARHASQQGSKVDKAVHSTPHHRHFPTAESINVQTATKRRNQISFPQLSSEVKRKVTFRGKMPQSEYTPLNSLRLSTRLQKQFTPQTQVLLRKQTGEIPLDHHIEFEPSPTTHEIYSDIRGTKPSSSARVVSRYKLIKPRREAKERDVPETRKPEQNVVSLLREAAAVKFESQQTGRKAVMDLKKALSPRSQLSVANSSLLNSPLSNPLHLLDQEAALQQYKIKMQSSASRSQEAAEKHSLMRSRAENVWVWRGKKGMSLPGKGE